VLGQELRAATLLQDGVRVRVRVRVRVGVRVRVRVRVKVRVRVWNSALQLSCRMVW